MKQLIQLKKWIAPVIAGCFILLIFWAYFIKKIETDSERRTISFITHIMNENRLMTHPYNFSQNLLKLNQLGMFNCLKLTQKSLKEPYFISGDNRTGCQEFSRDVSGINGEKWTISGDIKSSAEVVLLKFLGYFLISTFLVFSLFFYFWKVNSLQQAQLISQRYLQFRANLAKEVAHDIRSPLQVINTAIGFFRTESSAEVKAAEILKEAVARVKSISDGLLELSGGLTEEKLERVFLCEMVRSVVAQKRLELNEDSALQDSLHVEMDPDLADLMIKVNPSLFHRVLSNLLNNSMEAIQHPKINASPQVLVRLLRTKNFSSIHIMDNGPGFSSEIINSFSKSLAVSTKQGGHGIGLQSARRIIEGLDGKIEIRNYFSSQYSGAWISISVRISALAHGREIPSVL